MGQFVSQRSIGAPGPVSAPSDVVDAPVEEPELGAPAEELELEELADEPESDDPAA